eukprot:Seg888.19 transcript_id=Seg888.19/GoldUCD/mRNA.D3Y31 product="Serpin B6" protein_id=Seg888.19/GoldUCD/D3Y31
MDPRGLSALICFATMCLFVQDGEGLPSSTVVLYPALSSLIQQIFRMDPATLSQDQLSHVVLFLQNNGIEIPPNDKTTSAKDKNINPDLAVTLNKFAFNFMKLSPGDGSFFYSPYSIANALAMVYAGVKGPAKEEIATAFGWDSNNTVDLHKTFGNLVSKLTAHDGYATLGVANRVWIDRREKVQKSFAEILKKYYASKIGKADFFGNTERSRHKINSWVEENTGNKIKDMIPQGFLQQDTRIVLANAIYFKAAWKEPFNPAKTKTGNFNTAKNGMKRMKMMVKRFDSLSMAYEDDFMAIELPYEGGRFAMNIILPNQGKDLASVERSLNLDTFEKLEYYDYNVDVKLPRFELEKSYDLTRLLAKLNIKSMFNEKCDLSGMLRTSSHGLFFNNALHKSFIQVDEKGTKAAAATALAQGRSMTMQFFADRPFLFFIKDITSGVILFAGRFSP